MTADRYRFLDQHGLQTVVCRLLPLLPTEVVVSLGFWLALLAVLALSGCAGLSQVEYPGARAIEPGEAASLSHDEVLVFGRILFIENGANKHPYALGKPIWQLQSPPSLPAVKEFSGKRRVIPFLSTRKDGVFAYVIPAGHYQMGHVEPLYYMPFIRPALEFSAEQPGMAYYLGDLELDIEATSWLGGLWGNYITRLNHQEVVDRFDEVVPLVASPLVMPGTARKAMMVRVRGEIPMLQKQDTGGFGLGFPAGSIHFGR
jgi:hypothetical protein